MFTLDDLELIIHTYDIASGLQVPYDPPPDLVTAHRPHRKLAEPGPRRAERHSWVDMLRRYGREPGATPAP